MRRTAGLFGKDDELIQASPTHPGLTYCAVVCFDIETPGRRTGIDVALKAKAVRACLPVVLTSGRVVPALGALPPDIHFIGKP